MRSFLLHFAKLGHSVGAGVAIGSVAAPLFGPYAPLIGFIATIAGVVTHYADKGIAVYSK